MTSTCPHCGAAVKPQAKFCKTCGAQQPSQALAPVQLQGAKGPIAPTVLKPIGQNVGIASGQGELILSNGQRYPLISPTTIGRDDTQCDLVLPQDDQVSRCHARLEQFGNQWEISDLGSSNGTHVNGIRIQKPTPVQPGDQITIGRTNLSITIPGVASVVPAPAALAGPTPAGPVPLAGQAAGMGYLPALPSPAGGWRMWKRQPLAEGYVRHISERYLVKKDDLWKKGCLAAAIGLLIAPFLAFLPLLSGNDLPARDIRIEDIQSGRLIDVKVLGEIMGNINLGDPVAIWGRNQKGLLLMESAYNYETDSEIRVKKT